MRGELKSEPASLPEGKWLFKIEVGVQHHASAALPPRKKFQYSMTRSVGRLYSQIQPVWTMCRETFLAAPTASDT